MRTADDDDALAALAWALETGAFALPEGEVLFLNARPGHALPRPGWRCVQPLRPAFEALAAAGFDATPEIAVARCATALLRAPRSREATRAQLAQAVDALAPGGLIAAAAGNSAGGRGLQGDLAALLGEAQGGSKHRCRVAWARKDPTRINAGLLAQWRALDEVRQVVHGGLCFWTRPGLFAWDRVDAASALLAEHLPVGLAGRVADAGAGWGYLSMALLRRCPGIATLDLFEADARALEPARRNLEDALAGRTDVAIRAHWHDVTAGLPGRFDAVVTNPPFHLGRADDPALGRAFIASAAAALAPGGALWL
ncbi:MAG TPA: methyltransferase, partial [Chiayiivirga sp.]|nr:methyltransferase [Chiayiivirga sp.]